MKLLKESTKRILLCTLLLMAIALILKYPIIFIIGLFGWVLWIVISILSTFR